MRAAIFVRSEWVICNLCNYFVSKCDEWGACAALAWMPLPHTILMHKNNNFRHSSHVKAKMWKLNWESNLPVSQPANLIPCPSRICCRMTETEERWDVDEIADNLLKSRAFVSDVRTKSCHSFCVIASRWHPRCRRRHTNVSISHMNE